MKQIVFATNNAHKLSEIRQILETQFKIISLEELGCHDDIPETADTLQGNALQKAQYIHDKYHVDCFADDTGLEVEALDGAPGIYTARYGTMNGFGEDHDPEANTRCLLHNLQGAANRKAQFRTSIALIMDNDVYYFDGIVRGEIASEKRGDQGFGYDPVFIPEGYDETFAEMGVEVKNKISHRAKAVEKLAKYLLGE